MLFMKGIVLRTKLPIWVCKLLVFSGAVTLLLTFCPCSVVMLLACCPVDSVKALVLFRSSAWTFIFLVCAFAASMSGFF